MLGDKTRLTVGGSTRPQKVFDGIEFKAFSKEKKKKKHCKIVQWTLSFPTTVMSKISVEIVTISFFRVDLHSS